MSRPAGIDGPNTSKYKVVRGHFYPLVLHFEQDLTKIAAMLFEKGLISTADLDQARTNQPSFDRSSALMTKVLKKIEINQRLCDVFIEVLEDNHELADIASEVKEALKLEESCKSEPVWGHDSRGNNIAQATDMSGASPLTKRAASAQGAPAEQGSGKASLKSGTALDQTTGAGQPSKLKEKPSIKEFYLALKPIASEWKDIGILLDLPSGTLASLQSENQRDRDRMREMGVEWLKTLNADWGALIEAVKEVNEARALEIAVDIGQFYNA